MLFRQHEKELEERVAGEPKPFPLVSRLSKIVNMPMLDAYSQFTDDSVRIGLQNNRFGGRHVTASAHSSHGQKHAHFVKPRGNSNKLTMVD